MGAGHAPGSVVVGVTVALTIIAGIATVMRVFTRAHIVHTAGIDDLAIVVAMLLSIIVTVCMVKQVDYGMGKHYASLNPIDQTHALQWMWASVWTYYLALGAAKTSILLQYLRIFPQDRFRLVCFAMIAIVAVYTCWTFLSSLLACVPIASYWDKSMQGHCLPRLSVWFANAGINIATDVGTAILPLPVLKRLHLPQRQKIALMAVFGLGGITCIVSILRLQSLYSISVSSDVTWDNPFAAIWSSTEVNVGILCSCIPTLKGCVNRYFPRLFKDRSGRSTGGMPESISLTPGRLGTSYAVAGRGTPRLHDEQDEKKRGPDDGGIHVVTVMQQDFEDSRRRDDDGFSSAESESMRNFVPKNPADGV